MVYSDFTLPQVLQTFQLTVQTRLDLFADVPDVPIPPVLRDFLARNTTLALAVNTEEVRSELLIARLHGEVLTIDINEYLLWQVERILGILPHVVGPLPEPATAA